ncbi:MAG TPA: TrkA C-terminal domain-containing protein [bacterium]|nr:TrkA C-terminal domain-containing protein [bacterium]HPN42353.1 TrkA C-terminal domain-containing protein [bacterium]
MDLWDKIKTGLGEGLETISQKTSDMSKLAKLKWERRDIEKEIGREMVTLGGVVYQLHTEKKLNKVNETVTTNIEKLKNLEIRLTAKEKEIKDLAAKMDSSQIKGLKKDLDMGDGRIEQILVDESSPLADKKLAEIKFPKAVLIGTILRQGEVIIPDGQTILQKGDKVTLLGKKEDVEAVVEQLRKK